jgi:hypothetical protein
MLEELGVEPRIAAASGAWLRTLAESEVPDPHGATSG